METQSSSFGENSSEHTSTDDDLDNYVCKILINHADVMTNTVKFLASQIPNVSFTEKIDESDVFSQGTHYILWAYRGFKMHYFKTFMKYPIVVNMIHGVMVCLYKVLHATIYNQLKRHYPERFKFYPETYIMPRDKDLLTKAIDQSNDPNEVWISKINEGHHGDDIAIFKSLDELSKFHFATPRIVQKYVANPLLLNKKKWDFRTWVVIHGVNPMKAYLSIDNGAARF